MAVTMTVAMVTLFTVALASRKRGKAVYPDFPVFDFLILDLKHNERMTPSEMTGNLNPIF